MKLRSLLRMALAVGMAGLAATPGSAAAQPFPQAAQLFPQYGDSLYQPRLRQAGKDVIWLPTPDAMVARMLRAAKVTSRDLVYDLGAGDGKIAIAAAKQFGARAVGIEYNPDMAGLARRNAQRAGVGDKVEIIQGDIFKQDFSAATVVTLYLLPDLNYQLRPTLLGMKPGTRIVSYSWHMGEWEPDEVIRQGKGESYESYLWIVPASVAGRWTLRNPDNDWQAAIELAQEFQRIGGTITIAGVTKPLLGAYLQGTSIGFTFVAADGSVQSMLGTVSGTTMSGSLRFVNNLTPVVGQRR